MLISRRLIPLAAFAVGTVALSACSGGGGGAASPGAESPTTGAGVPRATATPPNAPAAVLPTCYAPGTAINGSPFPAKVDPAKDQVGKKSTIAVVPATADVYVGTNNFVFGITNTNNEPQPGAKVRATVYDLKDGKTTPVCQFEPLLSAPGVGPESNHTHAGGVQHIHGGEDASRVVYYARVPFAREGPWGLAVEAILKDGSKTFGSVLLQVGARPSVIAPGMPANRSDNLTKNDVKDIKEIDSGTPPNDMHDLKIKDVIAAGRPLVIVFSTPAFCQTLFCGPVNQEVEALRDVYKDRVDFIHIEIWRDFVNKVINPTAREWLLTADGRINEPIVFAVGKDGVIYDRWEGPAARNIMEASVKAIAEGAVYQK